MQQVETAASQALGVPFGHSSRAIKSLFAIGGGVRQPTSSEPGSNASQDAISLARNGGTLTRGFAVTKMKRTLMYRIAPFMLPSSDYCYHDRSYDRC